MTGIVSIHASPDLEQRRAATDRARSKYVYRPQSKSQLRPIATATAWPYSAEGYDFAWLRSFIPGWIGARLNHLRSWLDWGVQRLLFRFDLLEGYERLFFGEPPDFLANADDDADFAYRRIAGPNALALRRETALDRLLARIGLDVERIEGQLGEKFGDLFPDGVDLESEAKEGRLFYVDFRELLRALPAPPEPGDDCLRDSSWRNKYLAGSIGVFLEIRSHSGATELVPLAIEVDSPSPHTIGSGIHYPAQHPSDEEWGWRIAKLYFEAADVSYHVGVGHVYGTHLMLGPFCLATPRQLPPDHPIYVLLRPHTRYTLHTNNAVYKYATNRRKTYFAFYSGTLECQRRIMTNAYADRSFSDHNLATDLASRDVVASPSDYPYRDDAMLWLEPIRRFVKSYVDLFYFDDDAVAHDPDLQSWATELMDPERGAVRGLAANDRLDTRNKLCEVLSLVLFTAGPGHAAQHFSSCCYYRYSPAFPGAAWAPPPNEPRDAHKAAYHAALPPISVARRQFMFNTFTNYRFDTFGDYRRYPLGGLEKAQHAIERLQADLRAVDQQITERCRTRRLRYDFLRPTLVPNSVNV